MIDEYDYYTGNIADNMTHSDSVITLPSQECTRAFYQTMDEIRTKRFAGVCEILGCNNLSTIDFTCGYHYKEPLFRWSEEKKDWVKQI